MTIKLNQLRDVLAVARLGGIRPASRELGLAQPSLTKSIQQLEALLGVPLFERTGKRLRLTAYGEAFVARTRGAVNEIHRAENEVRQMKNRQTGHLAFAMGGIAMMNLLPGALKSFEKRHTGVSLHVVERIQDASLAALRAGEIEFAVIPQPYESVGTEFILSPLLRDRYLVIGRRGHPLANATTLQDLLSADWVVMRLRGQQASHFENLFFDRGLTPPRIAIQCESVVGVLSLLADTDLLAVLPARWLATEALRHVCIGIDVVEFGEATPLCVVWRSASPLTPAAAAFVAALEVEANALNLKD